MGRLLKLKGLKGQELHLSLARIQFFSNDLASGARGAAQLRRSNRAGPLKVFLVPYARTEAPSVSSQECPVPSQSYRVFLQCLSRNVFVNVLRKVSFIKTWCNMLYASHLQSGYLHSRAASWFYCGRLSPLEGKKARAGWELLH